MYQLANELSYTRTYQRNCLLIIKNYDQKLVETSQEFPKSSPLERFLDYFNPLNGLKSKHHQLCDTPLQQIYLQVTTDLKAVTQILEWYDQLHHLPIPKTVFWQCQLALVEGFTNAVRHAHKDLPEETPIELEVKVFNNSIEIRIWDYGQPFDLLGKINNSPSENRLLENQEVHSICTNSRI